MGDFILFTNYYRNILTTAGFKEWGDGFNTDNIPKAIRNRAFHIFYSIDSVTDNGDNLLTNDVTTTIKLFRKGSKDPKAALDDVMCDAISLRKLFMNQVSIANFTEVQITGISSVSIIPEPVNTNDNSIIVTLDFITSVTEDVAP